MAWWHSEAAAYQRVATADAQWRAGSQKVRAEQLQKELRALTGACKRKGCKHCNEIRAALERFER